MFCKKCGNKLEEGAKFCNKCGYSMQQKDFTPNQQQSVSAINHHTNKKIFAIIMIVVILAAIPITIINIKQRTEFKKIEKTIQYYSEAFSSLDIIKADSYCEEPFQNTIMTIFSDFVPGVNTGNAALQFLDKFLDPINYNLTRCGKIHIEKDIATVPVDVSFSISKIVFGRPLDFTGKAEVKLVKEYDEWLIKSLEISDVESFLKSAI